MTAPVLSPQERLVVDALGIHDLDILAAMEEHADDIVPCESKECDKPADVRAILTCCGHNDKACTFHFERAKGVVSDWLFALLLAGDAPTCRHCKHHHPVGSRFDDLWKVVGL